MIHQHSVAGRVMTCGIIGFITGALIFFGASAMGADLGTHFRLGLWLYYVLLGFLIGLAGVVEYHPVFRFKMPYWLRGALLGLVMHLMLVLLTYDQMAIFMQIDYVASMGMSSPFWALIDGVILGVFMDWIATKRCGEGMQKLS